MNLTVIAMSKADDAITTSGDVGCITRNPTMEQSAPAYAGAPDFTSL